MLTEAYVLHGPPLTHIWHHASPSISALTTRAFFQFLGQQATLSEMSKLLRTPHSSVEYHFLSSVCPDPSV